MNSIGEKRNDHRANSADDRVAKRQRFLSFPDVQMRGLREQSHAHNARLNSRSKHGSEWVQRADMVIRKLVQDEAEEFESKLIHSRVSVIIDPMRGVVTSKGDSCLRGINRDLDRFGITRTSVQKLFHFWFTQSILELIYGDDWDTSALRVMKKLRIDAMHHEVTIMTPRRFGKTWSVAMWVVAVLLNVPTSNIAIFSTGNRASKSLMKIIAGFIQIIPDAYARICKNGAEELLIALEPLPANKTCACAEARRKQALTTTSQLHSYPSGVTSKFLFSQTRRR
jgi:hypothetical protein